MTSTNTPTVLTTAANAASADAAWNGLVKAMIAGRWGAGVRRHAARVAAPAAERRAREQAELVREAGF